MSSRKVSVEKRLLNRYKRMILKYKENQPKYLREAVI